MNKLNPIEIELLRKRGITEKQDIMEFISPSPRRTYDPFLMLNMERAADIILESISSDKKIFIYGDYDADGITSVAILMQSLRKLTDNVFYYIPSRFIEGYGLNTEAIHNIKEKGADLIITVDCGSVSYNEIEYAKEQGIEVIVTDHHNIDERAADCLIVNPKQEACGYPFKELAGCGVAFKLVCALQRKLELDKSFIRDVLDLVAIGTIGDIVPLVDENRTLVKYGLKALRSTKRKGLLKLLEGSEVEVPVGANSKNAMVPMVTVNTKNILFICGGAFPDLENIIKERLNKQASIGFYADLKDKYDNDPHILEKVTVDDIRAFGMIPEFIGRLPIIYTLNGLNEDMLVQILKEPKNAILKQYQKLLALDEVKLDYEEEALHAIAAKALEKHTGARGLRAILEEYMLDIMYEIPKDDSIGQVIITREYIEGTGGPRILLRGQEIPLLSVQ